MESTTCLLVLAAFSVLSGCAAATESPTEAAAALQAKLRVAEPLQYGCTYTEEFTDSYGTATSTESRPKCAISTRCDEVASPSGSNAMYAGGSSVYTSSTTHRGHENFVGTCDLHVSLEATAECSAAAGLCLRDPNCLALRDCAFDCGKGEACVSSCVAAGELHARKNFIASVDCAAESKSPNSDLIALFSSGAAKP